MITRIYDKIIKGLEDEHTGEMLFFCGFILYLIRAVWDTTMFPFPGIANKLCLLAFLALTGLKILLFDSYTVKEFLIVAAALVGTIAIYVSSGYMFAFFWLLLVLGSKNISFEKIVKVYLVITGAIMFLAFSASTIGVIKNLVYSQSDRGLRMSFGIGYTTDFAAHVFFLVLSYYYVMREKLGRVHFAVTVGIAAFVWNFTKTRLDSGCILLTALCFWVNYEFQRAPVSWCRLKNGWTWFWEHCGMWIMPVLAGISIGLTAMYQENSSFLVELDKIVSSRLTLGKRGFEDFGIKLWGQDVPMVGGGGTTKSVADYFFIDCSYMHILLRFGVVFLVMVLLAYAVSCKKNKKDIYFQMCIGLLAVNCVIAHHIIDIAYNPFICALLAVGMCSKVAKSRKG